MSDISLLIEKLSHEGRGIARHHGKTCFVSGALPGETVEARLLRRHARLEEYGTIRVVHPSPDRVTPPCGIYGRCGGCDLQHLETGAQVAHKQLTLLDMLARQAGIHPECIEVPLTAEPWHYRSRARLSIGFPRRSDVPETGFREEGGHQVVPVAACPVLEKPLEALPAVLSAVVSSMQQPRSLGHIELSLSESADGRAFPVILLRSVAVLADADVARWQACAREQQSYCFVQSGEDAFECLHAPCGEAPGYCLTEFGLRLEYSGGDFLQANRRVNRALVHTVVDWLAPQPGMRVLDAFAGLGNFALPMARRGAQVHGLEVSRAMVDGATANAARHGLTNAQFSVCDLQASHLQLPAGDFDAVVLDPPRSGASVLVGALVKRKVPRVLYVSCAPAMLARDAKALAAAGYVLDRLALADMFPQTAHLESVALFVKSGKRKRPATT